MIPADNPEHRAATHKRWVADRNRRTASPDNEEAWYAERCGACWFYVPLAGEFAYDWGVCTNPASAFDRRAMFEHDGCDHHEATGEWVSASDADVVSGDNRD